MNSSIRFLIIPLLVFFFHSIYSQDSVLVKNEPVMTESKPYEIKTLFGSVTGGYGAITNKFTRLGGVTAGDPANMLEVHGGVMVSHSLMVGVSLGALTSNFPADFRSVTPTSRISYRVGHIGLMVEYTLWSHRVIHLSFQFMNGAGFAKYYERAPKPYQYDPYSNFDNYEGYSPTYAQWFLVTEPGVKVEINITKWFRLCPGASYRAAYMANQVSDMRNEGLSDLSINLTTKFGKF
jgi:hypothetical protein